MSLVKLVGTHILHELLHVRVAIAAVSAVVGVVHCCVISGAWGSTVGSEQPIHTAAHDTHNSKSA